MQTRNIKNQYFKKRILLKHYKNYLLFIPTWRSIFLLLSYIVHDMENLFCF